MTPYRDKRARAPVHFIICLPFERRALIVPAPIRIIQQRPVKLQDDRIVCKAVVSRIIVVGSALLGLAGLGVTALVPVGTHDAPVMIAFVLFPSCGFLMGSVFLLFYDRRTVIEVPQKQVSVQERMMYLPMNTHRYELDDFDEVAVSVRTPGRESNPGNYSTLMLRGEDCEAALFDMEDYSEARRTARRLSELLGLGKPR
jgi:hypothetical protein